jgi:hypothetical protein
MTPAAGRARPRCVTAGLAKRAREPRGGLFLATVVTPAIPVARSSQSPTAPSPLGRSASTGRRASVTSPGPRTPSPAR